MWYYLKITAARKWFFVLKLSSIYNSSLLELKMMPPSWDVQKLNSNEYFSC